jgi:hypothetical protein
MLALVLAYAAASIAGAFWLNRRQQRGTCTLTFRPTQMQYVLKDWQSGITSYVLKEPGELECPR